MKEYNKIIEKIEKSIKKMNLKTLINTKKIFENELLKDNTEEMKKAYTMVIEIIEKEINKKMR